MDSTSQQTDVSSEGDEIREQPLCTRLWPYVWPLILSVAFVGFALILALIYMGFGTKDRYVSSRRARIQTRKTRKINVALSRIHEYPFVGALISEKPYLFLCAVAVLTNRYLLTGANCFTTNFPNLLVRVGSDRWDSKGREYQVQSFIINEDFNGTSLDNNIALIRLKEDIIMDRNIRPVKMETSRPITAKDGIVLGWNYWAMADRMHVRLIEQRLLIWKPARCSKYLGNETTSKFICASLNNTLCNLDVTGLLIVNGKLVGFWSWGLSCTEVPSIFSNFHYFKKWISSKIRTGLMDVDLS